MLQNIAYLLLLLSASMAHAQEVVAPPPGGRPVVTIGFDGRGGKVKNVAVHSEKEPVMKPAPVFKGEVDPQSKDSNGVDGVDYKATDASPAESKLRNDSKLRGDGAAASDKRKAQEKPLTIAVPN